MANRYQLFRALPGKTEREGTAPGPEEEGTPHQENRINSARPNVHSGVRSCSPKSARYQGLKYGSTPFRSTWVS